MDPAFWNNLSQILVALNVIIVTIIGWKTRKADQKIDAVGKKVDLNTHVTIKKNDEVSEKLDSAARETVTNTAEAKKAANFAAARSVVIERKQDQIGKQLNGGPGGLGETNARVAAIEETVKSLVYSVNHLSDIIERKIV